MKSLSLLLSLMPFAAFAEDSYLFKFAHESKPSGHRIEGHNLIVAVPIQKIETPKAQSITAFHQGLGPARKFKIQINLDTDPDNKRVVVMWTDPMFKLGNEIVMRGITVEYRDKSRIASSISIQSSDAPSIRRWCRELGILFGLPEERIKINLTEAEQGGTGQPATRSQSKSEDSYKPQPEAEGRSR